ncbi:MAG: hypothetical protein WC787_01790 [Patescibacteria group bacterium]|jgi:hypothetical protein
MKYLLLCTLLFSAIPFSTHAATNGSLIKSASSSAVYYLLDGKRYAFPNEKVYFSWYSGFNSVVTVSSSELASYSLAGNVTYRPGLKLIKIQTDPKVYAVSRYGVLRWLSSESVASALYGSNWNMKVDDVADTFFTNYTVGGAISVEADFNPNAELGTTMIAQNIQGAIVPPPPPSGGNVTTISGCQVFPADNAWNQRVDSLAVHAKSATFINAISATKKLHPDFGENQEYGIPFNVVPGSQAKVPITWTAYGEESDPGPYPIPSDAKQEAASDRHVLVLDKDNCKLYELFNAEKNTGAGWSADSGAIWDLKTNALRPYGWTSADAAGLPILPGLIRYDEVAAGEIRHAIRFTAPSTQKGYILPATHHAGQTNTDYPPMGLRVRLKANYDISNVTGQARVIAEAMKTYGMMLADNGSSWFFQGATDPRWNDDELNQLKGIPGSAFEAVETGPILN